jgi:hypothetical protein
VWPCLDLKYDFGFKIKFVRKFQSVGTADVVAAWIREGGLTMTFGRGALFWLLGIPLPVILLLALFWR